MMSLNQEFEVLQSNDFIVSNNLKLFPDCLLIPTDLFPGIVILLICHCSSSQRALWPMYIHKQALRGDR